MPASRAQREQLLLELEKIGAIDLRWRKGSALGSKAVRRGWQLVAAWVAKNGLALPASGSASDKAFVSLLTTSDVPQELLVPLGAYLSERLDGLAGFSKPCLFEGEIPDRLWRSILDQADMGSFLGYIRSRLRYWSIWIKPLRTLLLGMEEGRPASLGPFKKDLEALLDQVARNFPRQASVEYTWWEHNLLLSPIALRAMPQEGSHEFWRVWLLRFFKFHGHSVTKLAPALADLSAQVFNSADWKTLLEGASVSRLVALHSWNSNFFRRLEASASGQMAFLISSLWDTRSFETANWRWTRDEGSGRFEAKEVLSLVGPELRLSLARHIGLAIGLTLVRRERTLDRVDEILGEFGLPRFDELPEAVRFQIRLWRELQVLAEYEQHRYLRTTEIIGLRSAITEMVSEYPSGWAYALPWVLECSQHLGGLCESVTVLLMDGSSEITGELQRLAESAVTDRIRNCARGIMALSSDLLDPSERLWHDLLSLVSRQFDSFPFRAQPLAVASSTWLNSHGAENLLRATITEAESSFQSYFVEQGGIEEESVTSRLLAELEHAFRGTQARIRGLERSSPLSVSLSQRQVRKREEKLYGCDIAFLVAVNSPWAQGVTLVELVQVKKPVRESRRRIFLDRWRIDRPQLSDLLAVSPGAVYWLLGIRGEVLVVPGKFLQAVQPVKRDGIEGREFHVDYLRVRSAAIPLSQFLMDLLMGLWLGTTHDKALQFARGDGTLSPRFIVELTLDLSRERQG